MNALQKETPHPMEAIKPLLRGRLRAGVMLGPRCWFQVGGPAEWLFTPEDDADLRTFFAECDLPVMVMGVGSNLLIRDGGVDGVVIRLGRYFAGAEVVTAPSPMRGKAGMGVGISANIEQKESPTPTSVLPLKGGGSYILAGAAALDLNVAVVAAEAGIAGLEFLSGIPGTIGGAVAMNAGAYGREMKDILEYAEVMTPDGTIHRMTAEELQLTYRHAELPEGAIVLRALLKGEKGDKETIKAAMNKIQEERASTQPIKSRTGGSTFKNPPGKKAWQLVDEAGCRGLKQGSASVSEKHTNFLINEGGATAKDLEVLGETVRRCVREKHGIDLEWEIKRIGKG